LVIQTQEMYLWIFNRLCCRNCRDIRSLEAKDAALHTRDLVSSVPAFNSRRWCKASSVETLLCQFDQFVINLYLIDYFWSFKFQVQVFTRRPRNGRIKLCNCANTEIQLSKLCRQNYTEVVHGDGPSNFR